MSAISHYCGGDLLLDNLGGLAIASGDLDTQQRILRRLCTNPGGYIWQLDYGAGLPAMIGDPIQHQNIRGIVLAQMQLEDGVDQTQPISVSVAAQGNGQYLCVIGYVDAQTQAAQSLELTN